MRSHLDEPLILNLAHLSHVFFACEDQLVVHHPSGERLEQATVRVNVNCLLVLGGLVRACLAQACRVIEETGRDGFAYGDRVVITGHDLYLDSLH